MILDECYTDIYTKIKPVGGMEICQKTKAGLNNVCIFHSLSKRSNVAGLRSGFVVGDKKIIKLFSKLRSYSAPTIPLPIQTLSAKLWSDESHVLKVESYIKVNLITLIKNYQNIVFTIGLMQDFIFG